MNLKFQIQVHKYTNTNSIIQVSGAFVTLRVFRVFRIFKFSRHSQVCQNNAFFKANGFRFHPEFTFMSYFAGPQNPRLHAAGDNLTDQVTMILEICSFYYFCFLNVEKKKNHKIFENSPRNSFLKRIV